MWRVDFVSSDTDCIAEPAFLLQRAVFVCSAVLPRVLTCLSMENGAPRPGSSTLASRW